MQSSMAPASFVGPVVYNDKDKFKKVDFGEIDKEAADPARKPAYTQRADNGWIGMIEHYFVAAWLPPRQRADAPVLHEQARQRPLHGRRALRRQARSRRAPPATLRARLYVGPQDQDVLAKLAPGRPRASRARPAPAARRRAAPATSPVRARRDRPGGRTPAAYRPLSSFPCRTRAASSASSGGATRRRSNARPCRPSRCPFCVYGGLRTGRPLPCRSRRIRPS